LPSYVSLARAAAILCAGVAILHALIPAMGPGAYLYFGAGPEFADAATAGELWPHLATIFIAGVFATWALYGWRFGDGPVPLPFPRTIFVLIALAFTLRGAAVIPQLVGMVLFEGGDGSIEPRDLAFSAVSLGIGLLHFIAFFAWRRFQRQEARE
jgi:hypothetical protein